MKMTSIKGLVDKQEEGSDWTDSMAQVLSHTGKITFAGVRRVRGLSGVVFAHTVLIQWRGSHRQVKSARGPQMIDSQDEASAPTLNDASSHLLFPLGTTEGTHLNSVMMTLRANLTFFLRNFVKEHVVLRPDDNVDVVENDPHRRRQERLSPKEKDRSTQAVVTKKKLRTEIKTRTSSQTSHTSHTALIEKLFKPRFEKTSIEQLALTSKLLVNSSPVVYCFCCFDQHVFFFQISSTSLLSNHCTVSCLL